MYEVEYKTRDVKRFGAPENGKICYTDTVYEQAMRPHLVWFIRKKV
jgi:hypothetical protein